MYEVAHPPRARGGFRCSAGARWQKNAFRCSFGRSIGSETGFGAVRTPSAPASAEFACVFRCKNNEKTDLAPPFWRPDGQNGESGPQSAAITAPKPVWLPGGSGLLHRNPFAYHPARRDCARARPAVSLKLHETHSGARDARNTGTRGRLPESKARARAPRTAVGTHSIVSTRVRGAGHRRGDAGRTGAPGARERPPAGLTRRKSHAQRGGWG